MSLQLAVHKTLKQAPAASFETNCIIGDGDVFVNDRNGYLVFGRWPFLMLPSRKKR